MGDGVARSQYNAPPHNDAPPPLRPQQPRNAATGYDEDPSNSLPGLCNAFYSIATGQQCEEEKKVTERESYLLKSLMMQMEKFREEVDDSLEVILQRYRKPAHQNILRNSTTTAQDRLLVLLDVLERDSMTRTLRMSKSMAENELESLLVLSGERSQALDFLHHDINASDVHLPLCNYAQGTRRNK